ncbi:MAG: Phosphoenolpyruvate synthase [Candidatus Woesearchaeota archaeon]|nr:Phosphoenolpyruvate synthase [Candidatus Woesearchaeota archaeon]
MKYVYYFGEGKKGMKDILGGKGLNLGVMTNIGIPVPPGFTITTQACKKINENNKWPEGLKKELDENIARLQEEMQQKLSDDNYPLLLSVRSGAAVSMPGMMDTVLNLGMNDKTVKVIANKTDNPRFAWDSYRRFIQMFGNVVMGIKHHYFEEVLDNVKETKGVKFDTELEIEDLKKVVKDYKKVVAEHAGKDFPQDPHKQLEMSIDAVFGSWDNKRAISYRRINNIKGLIGTAVNIQTMVFGNMGDDSGTGVLFTRNPANGEKEFYGEFLMNAQGEDVVAGIRTPKDIKKLKQINQDVYDELVEIYEKVEHYYKDMQDMEFTIQKGKLYILQTRTGKRTAQAAVKIAVDMVNEELIDKKQAILRIDPDQLDQLLHKQIDELAKKKHEVLAKGLPASPGAAVGEVVFDADTAFEWTKQGKDVVLVRVETSPEDIEGMNAAKGVLTARGGMTSHAAVVARGMGKCCVAGCGDIDIDYENSQFTVNNTIVQQGDYITLDGGTGELFKGRLPVKDPEVGGSFATIMKWADEFRKIGVRTNADIPRDAKVALEFGAEGIGLCRTEHMFFEGERIKHVRKMILADNETARKKALDNLLPYQKSDFKGLFEVMGEKPVVIRTLDPPLHEFLPKKEEDIELIAKEMQVSVEKIKASISDLHEFNPMLGHRGCRLGITYPEITAMQARAIVEAACEVSKENDLEVKAEIMIPLVGNVKELADQKKVVQNVIDNTLEKFDMDLHIMIGTMIEIPRAAITADEIAKQAEFFSFGTNDLTQMTCGFSRDDAGKFLKEYVQKGIYSRDPFQVLDQDGVGKIMTIAVEKGRKTNPKIELGICGEHGGEPSSVIFSHKIGLDYVSCSPYRVPIARLAAAHAVLKK